MYDYPAQVIKIVDGDTIDVIRDAGADIQQKMRIRLSRINAPEMSTTEGKTAKEWLTKQLTNSDGTLKTIYLFTSKDRKEDYGRYLGEFWLWGEDFTKIPSINDRLVLEGFAEYKKY
jgi:endonuclease YncB( thermonuclease family)